MRRFTFLVVLCSLATVVLSTPLLLKKDCAKGPEVWCQNLRTASDCKAVKHCQQNVWNKPTPTVESIPCDLCKEVVQVVGKILKKNETMEDINEYFNKVCEFLLVCGALTLCQMVHSMEKVSTSPKMVCVMLRCCTNDVLPAEEIVPVQSQVGNICDVCKMIVAYADKELAKNATTAEIEAFLERVCHYLPESVSDQCVQFVKQYEPTVVQLLAEMMDPTFVCNKLGVCATSTQPLLGSEFCVRGPGYWCKNMETASQCNAVEHCKRHVWN
uniref:Prosaposin n=1 Tax=Ailuropoda melanoleuca TaxID=9646 RepID=A0A7N5KB46_AILME